MVDTNGVLWTVAGTKAGARTGDTGSAISASVLGPRGAAFDAFGNLMITELDSASIRMIAYGTSPHCPAGYACPCALRPVPCASPDSVCPTGTAVPQNSTPGFLALGIPVELPPATTGYASLVCSWGYFCYIVTASPPFLLLPDPMSDWVLLYRWSCDGVPWWHLRQHGTTIGGFVVHVRNTF